MSLYRSGSGLWRIGQGGLATAPAAGGASGWWLAGGIDPANCVAAYQAIGAASQAASYVNLANPGTYDLTAPAAPAWAAGTGWTFNGSTHYLATGIVPASGMSLAIRFSGRSANADAWEMGSLVISPLNVFGFIGRGNNGQIMWNYTAERKTANNINMQSGVLISTPTNGYRDGTVVVSSAPSFAANAFGMFIGATNTSGTATRFSPATIQAVAIYSVNIDAQQADLCTAMAALS